MFKRSTFTKFTLEDNAITRSQRCLVSGGVAGSKLLSFFGSISKIFFQVLENFFDTRVAVPPYKPTSLFTFCNMLNVPINLLKDFIQIMKLELIPGLLQQQGMRWSVQWMLRVPPSAIPIVPTGMSGVLAFRAKVLFFVSFILFQSRRSIIFSSSLQLQITRVGAQYLQSIEPISVVLPLIYDVGANITQLAEKREAGSNPAMTAASQLLKQFSQFPPTLNECSVYPAIRELLINLTLPSEPQPATATPGGIQQIQPAAMQMHGQGQQGYPMNIPMGMMGPQ